ncbi:MAG TPA: phosphatidate cytidylyltransferase [Coriobacteriia bacterium]|nr:phosphatidate cytidylyltransferase [Coriobacteriia bacterium]
MVERLHTEIAEPAGIKPRSLIERVGTAVLYGAVVLGSLWLGPIATGVVFGIMSGFAAAEFYAMERRETRLPNEAFGIAAAAVMPIAAAFWGLPGLSATVTALIAASLVWHTMFRRTRTVDTAITVFGAVYTGFLLGYLVLILRTYESGLFLSVLLVVSVWVNDVAAYFIGSLLGRHKMVPHISPKKSWEGFAAGSAGTILIWALAPLVPGSGLTLAQAVPVGIAVALAAVIGDLAESRMKREAGVKDSGNSLPGHGGFLDRLDSLILVCLVAYWVLWWGGVR